MIKHIVMWTLKDQALGRDKSANAAEIQERLLALPAKLPLARELKVAVEDAIFASVPPADVVLYSSFDSREDLQTYAMHPLHLEVVEFIKQVVVERRVVDIDVS